MASVTLLSIRTWMRGQLQEPTESFWLDTELNGYINQAQADLYNNLNLINEDFFQNTETLTYVAGDTKKVLNSNFFRLLNIRTTTTDKGDLKWMYMDQSAPAFIDGLNQTENMDNVRTMLYDVIEDNLGANYLLNSPPMPYAATVEVTYVSQIPDLANDTGTMKIFDSFCTYIRCRAMMYALMKGPSGDFASWKVLADEQVNVLKAIAGRRQTKDPEYVRGFLEDDY